MRRLVTVLAAVGVAGSLIPTAALPPASALPIRSAATVPTGFVDEAVATVSKPTALAYLSDQRILVAEQTGRIALVTPGSPTAATVGTIDVCSSGEMGLLGLATDNRVQSNGQIYVYASRPVAGGCVNRVSRFTMSGTGLVPGSEVVLLDNIPGTVTDPLGNHNGGDLELASDGNLYVSVGDSGSDPRGDSGSAGANDAAQDLSILSGKILRIRPDGSIPDDNPFTGPGSVSCATAGVSTPSNLRCREIYAYGLRNPYRFAFDPNPGGVRFFINDVGQSTREEVDSGGKGANYGWPTREGACIQTQSPPCTPSTGGETDPLTDYGRAGGCTYITGGAFVPNGTWSGYDGAYFFADGGCGKVFVRDAGGNVAYDAPFASGLTGITDMAFLPDDTGYSLYYVTNGANSVRRIRPANVPSEPAHSQLRFTSVTPTRVFDSRNDIGTATGWVRGGTSRVIDLGTAYPAATAVLVNVTMVEADGFAYSQVWPANTRRPGTSAVNTSAEGDVVANATVVPLHNGRFVVSTTATTHLVVDLLGWYTSSSPSGGELRALPPTRLADTRRPVAADNPYQVVGDHVDVQVAGKAGVPADAGSVVFVLTAINRDQGGDGFVTAYPAGQARPNASNVNVRGGADVRANLVMVPIGADGKVSLYGFGVGDMLVDVAGWITAPGTALTGKGQLSIGTSQRVYDSRLTEPPFSAGETRSVLLANGAPSGSTAVLQNLTVTGTQGWGFLTAYPSGTTRPDASNLNYTGAGQTRAALTLTQLSADRIERVFSYGSTHVIVDRYGVFS